MRPDWPGGEASPGPRKNPAKDNTSNKLLQCGIVIPRPSAEQKGVHYRGFAHLEKQTFCMQKGPDKRAF